MSEKQQERTKCSLDKWIIIHRFIYWIWIWILMLHIDWIFFFLEVHIYLYMYTYHWIHLLHCIAMDDCCCDRGTLWQKHTSNSIIIHGFHIIIIRRCHNAPFINSVDGKLAMDIQYSDIVMEWYCFRSFWINRMGRTI